VNEAGRQADKPRQREVIGIIGGLGPYAHLALERQLLEAARDLLGASTDQDFPEWIVSCIPSTPDRTLAIQGRAPNPVPWLLRSLRRLDRPNQADFVIVACNTAHQYLPELRRQARIPVLDMPWEACRHASEVATGSRVGVLATTGTLTAGLYQKSLSDNGLAPASLLDLRRGPHLQDKLVMRAIYGNGTTLGIKGCGPTPESRRKLEEAAGILIDECGTSAIILGCTEISAALRQDSFGGVPLVDPLRVIARVAISRAYALSEKATGPKHSRTDSCP